jgi:hypothetical protein
MRAHGGGGVLETMLWWAVAHVGVGPLQLFISLCVGNFMSQPLGYQDEHHNGRMSDRAINTSRDCPKAIRGHFGGLHDSCD